jgi:hypothetical protein
MARPAAQGAATLHFVDDRFETMHYIAEQAPDLMGRWVRAVACLGCSWVGCCRQQQLSGLVTVNTTRCFICPHTVAHPCRWQLYLADWGYNTEEERAAAAALPGVRLLSLPDFCELLRWGVLMGVSGQVAAGAARLLPAA